MEIIFVGFSTVPGQKSTVRKDRGSLFIKVLTECLQKHGTTIPLEDLYLIITSMVAEEDFLYEGTDGTAQQYRQVPQKVSTLRKKLYFSPKPKTQVHCILCYNSQRKQVNSKVEVY